MADFLFCFVGRQNRLAYLAQLLVSAVSVVAILAISAAMGDWPFKGIVLGVLIAAVVAVYVSAITNRLQDLGTHPLIGIGLYFILPGLIFMVGNSVVGETYTGAMTIVTNALMTRQMLDVTPVLVLSWLSQIASIGLFAFGQLKLLFKSGDRGTNSYGEAPTGWIGHTRPEGA